MKVYVSAAVLSSLVVGVAVVTALWAPAFQASRCVFDLTAARCAFLGVDLWSVPDWALADYHFPALLPLMVAVPVAAVTGLALLLLGRVFNRRQI